MVTVQVNIPTGYPRSSQTLSDNVPRIVISYFVWLAIYFVSGWLSKVLLPPVRKLKPKDQMFWGLSMVRGMCGLLTLWGVRLVFFDKNLSLDHVYASTDESWAFLSVLTGFFIFEELTLIFFDMKYGTFSKELHLHHLFAFNGFFIAAYTNTGHYYAAQVFILEASTPFSCICWCLLKLKLEKSTAWKANQWLLIYIFHSRTFYELWCWYVFYHDWDYMKSDLPWAYIANLFTGLGLVTVWLTPYWTYKKTAQFFNPVDWNSEVKGKKKELDIDKTS